MKLKELLKELNDIKDEHGGEMDIILYDIEKTRQVQAKKITYEGYMRPEAVWIKG